MMYTKKLEHDKFSFCYIRILAYYKLKRGRLFSYKLKNYVFLDLFRMYNKLRKYIR